MCVIREGNKSSVGRRVVCDGQTLNEEDGQKKHYFWLALSSHAQYPSDFSPISLSLLHCYPPSIVVTYFLPLLSFISILFPSCIPHYVLIRLLICRPTPLLNPRV